MEAIVAAILYAAAAQLHARQVTMVNSVRRQLLPTQLRLMDSRPAPLRPVVFGRSGKQAQLNLWSAAHVMERLRGLAESL